MTKLEYDARLISVEVKQEQQSSDVVRGILLLDLDGKWGTEIQCPRATAEQIVAECGPSLKGSRWRLTLERLP